MPATAMLPQPPARIAATPQNGPDLRLVAGDVVREMIRRDPALWARVQTDPHLRRQFGFDDATATV